MPLLKSESVLGDLVKPTTTEKSATLVTSPTQQQQEESTTFAPTTAMNTPATPGIIFKQFLRF